LPKDKKDKVMWLFSIEQIHTIVRLRFSAPSSTDLIAADDRPSLLAVMVPVMVPDLIIRKMEINALGSAI
jgi:hypothetical protein